MLDARGVNEALNETTGGMSPYPTWIRTGEGISVRGRHLMLLSDAKEAMKELRMHMDESFSPFSVFYGGITADEREKAHDIAKLLGEALPVNINLLTIEEWYENVLLVRLAHQFAVVEDDYLSNPVKLDFGKLFAPLSPVKIEEVTLTANQLRSDMESRKIRWGAIQSQAMSKSDPFLSNTLHGVPSNILDVGSMTVIISPMEVRTFFLYI